MVNVSLFLSKQWGTITTIISISAATTTFRFWFWLTGLYLSAVT